MSSNFAQVSGIPRAFLDAARSMRFCHDPVTWAERDVVFPPGAPIEGPYRSDVMPAHRDIMRAMSDQSPAGRVIVVGGAQWGKTLCVQLGALGQPIAERPGPFLVVVPDEGDIASWYSGKLMTLFGFAASLGHLVEKTHDRVHNVGRVEFARGGVEGGFVAIRHSKSPQTFAQDAYRVVILDDVDRAALPGEGDIIELAYNRTTMYRHQGGKVVAVSTPTTKDGVIWREYLRSSQNQWHVPCPDCGVFQVLEPRNMTWTPGVYVDARFKCITGSSCEIDQSRIRWMNARGYWAPKNPAMSGVVEGFHLWQGCCPPELASWADYARAFELAETAMAAGDSSAMQTVVNQRQGYPFDHEADKEMDETFQWLLGRRHQSFPQTLLDRIVIRAVGTDVQPKFLETTVGGVCPGFETLVLDHKRHDGSWAESSHWDRWADYVLEQRPQVVCVDGGWQRTPDSDAAVELSVIEQLTRLFPRFHEAGVLLWVTKGVPGLAGLFWPQGLQLGNLGPDGVMRVVSVRVDFGKDWLYGSFKARRTSGENAIHLDVARDKRYVRQLLNERRNTKPGSSARYVLRKAKARVEALDCLVLVRAGAESFLSMFPDFRQYLAADAPPLPGRAAPAQYAPPPVPVVAAELDPFGDHLL